MESGGRRLIRIADDGCGMLRDDALLAFERHATSKLRDVKDLLPSRRSAFAARRCPPSPPFRACCSKRARRKRRPAPRRDRRRQDAALRRSGAAAAARSITVRDLFFNVPARRKFLRTEQTELAHIASLVTHYSLAHPDKSFELRHGAAIAARRHARGDACRERVYQVFGSQMLDELVDLGYTERVLTLGGGG